MLSEITFNFCVVQCGARSWTQWSLWVLSKSGCSMILFIDYVASNIILHCFSISWWANHFLAETAIVIINYINNVIINNIINNDINNVFITLTITI